MIPDDTQRRLREELAAAYRVVAAHGLTTLIQNHISMRLSTADEHERFLINPFGLAYEEVTASSLVVIDRDGQVVTPGAGTFGSSVNPAGFVVHRAVHAAREDARCVLHTHTEAGSAVAAMECGLLPLCIEAMMFYEDVGYHAFEGVTLDVDECARIAEDLGMHRALVLRNHGLLTVGRTVAEALVAMLNLERACRVQVAACASGQSLVRVSAEVARKVSQQARTFLPNESLEERTFRALVRGLDRDGSDFRS